MPLPPKALPFKRSLSVSGYVLRGAAEPMAQKVGGLVAGGNSYSLLLRRETDCKAVLFFSSAAFCCCETQGKREMPKQLSPRDYLATHPGQARIWQLPSWVKADTVVEGIRVVKSVLQAVSTAYGLWSQVWAAPMARRGTQGRE